MSHKLFNVLRFCFILLALGLLGLVGCDGSSMVNVQGKIYYGGQPLKSTGLDQAFVQFHKQGEGSDHMMYQGNFDEEGNYTLEAPPGKYKVLVFATKMPTARGGPSNINYGIPVTVIPKVYSSLNSTDKFVEVTSDTKPGDYDIKLTKPK